MRVSTRLLPIALVVALLVVALPAAAQIQLEGLDFGDDEESETQEGDDEVDIDVGGAEVKEEEGAMTLQGLDVSEEGQADQKAAMDAAVGLVEDENFEAAAVAFYKILQDPAAAEFHPEAEYRLGKSLYRLGMYHSALDRFEKILAAGEAHKFFDVSLEWLFFISRKTVNESVVLEDIARYADYPWPQKYRDEFLYLLAKYHFSRGRALVNADQKEAAAKSFEEAARLVSGVSPTSEFMPKARFLEGLTLYQAGRPNEALEKFKEVVRVLNPQTGRFENADLRDLAFMQLARLSYEYGQNSNALFYYDKIRRDSDQWLRSLFEKSWADFRLGDYERALGNMVTLHSPFFADEYFPESLILKAVIYYENCRYPEAKRIVDTFERVYGPVLVELEELSGAGHSPGEYYDVLADARRKQADDPVLDRILKAALTDQEFAAMNASIVEVEQEMDSIPERRQVFKFSDLARDLIAGLKETRRDLIHKAGLMAAAKLYGERQTLESLVGQGLRIRFETTTKEKEFLEKELVAGERLDVVQEYGYSVAVSDEELFWPYEGEYWRDELGTYQYTLTKGCREPRDARASRE